jgi:hypothetical protein
VSLNHNISTNQLTLLAILLLGLVLAVFIGSLIGGTDYATLGIIFGVVGALIYVGAFSPYWIWLALIYGSFGFMMRPLGPNISPLNVSVGLALIFVFAVFWRKSGISPAYAGLRQKFSMFTLLFIVYLTYMLVHALVSKLYPHTSALVSWNNLLKQNLEMWGPFLMVYISLRYAQFCKLPKNFGVLFSVFLILALAVNIAIRAYATFILNVGARDELMHDPSARYQSALFVPGINLWDDQYLLRGLAPFATLWGIAFFIANPRIVKVPRLISAAVVLFGLMAAFFAGGRATVILAFAVPGLYLLTQRKWIYLLIGGAMAVLLLVTVRYTFEVNHKLVPLMVQRSIALIPGMDMADALDSIEGSSDWRYDLFTRAFDEWQSSTRTLLIGRGVYAYTSEDIMAMMLDPNEGVLVSSLLRGATHNTITDLLLISGVVGFIIFYAVYFSLVYGVYSVLRSYDRSDVISVMSSIFIISSLSQFLIGLFGGGFLSNMNSLLAAAIIIQTLRSPHQIGVERQEPLLEPSEAAPSRISATAA